MTVDLKTQLRDYTEFFTTTINAIDIEEILQDTAMVGQVQLSDGEGSGTMQTQTPTTVRGSAPWQPRSWRKSALAFVVGLFAILIAAGGIAVWVGGSNSDVGGDPTPTTQVGEFPPFHMVLLTTRSDGTDTSEIWYLDEDTVRETVTDSSIAERIGTFELTADGYASNCYTGEGLCERRDISQDPDHQPLIFQIPLPLVEETCTGSSEDTVAGRLARHFACEGVHFVYKGLGGYWMTETSPAGVTFEHWFDSGTGLHVKSDNGRWVVEATILEIDPVFPEGIFEYEELVFPSDPSTG